jgi:hypothetical protein
LTTLVLGLDGDIGEGGDSILLGLSDKDLLAFGMVGHLEGLHGWDPKYVVRIARGHTEGYTDHYLAFLLTRR